MPSPRPWLALDRPGAIQAIGGLILGLIALFTSYDHLTLAGLDLPIQQPWGIVCIAASVATVVVDAELASRSRLRAAHETAEERNRAAEARDRQAEAAERQRQSLAELHRSALLCARFQLDPSAPNRQRLQAFLALIAPSPDQQSES